MSRTRKHRTWDSLKVAVMHPYREHPLLEAVVKRASENWNEYQSYWTRFYIDDDSWTDFNLAASRNLCVKEAEDYDVVIICDADTYSQRVGNKKAVEAAWRDGMVHQPFTRYERRRGSQLVYETRHALGQVYVCRPDAWDAVGGQDVRFTHWGPEDEAFRISHELHFNTPFPRQPGRAISRDHDPLPRPSEHVRDRQQALLGDYRDLLRARRRA